MSDTIPWSQVFQMGFAAVMALSLLYVLVKKIDVMIEAFFQNSNKVSSAVEAAADRQTKAFSDLSDAIKYAHNLAPRGMTPRGGDTPTPGAMPAPGATR